MWSERGYSNENKDNLIDSVFLGHGRKVLYPNYSIVLYMQFVLSPSMGVRTIIMLSINA